MPSMNVLAAIFGSGADTGGVSLQLAWVNHLILFVHFAFVIALGQNVSPDRGARRSAFRRLDALAGPVRTKGPARRHLFLNHL